MVEVNRLTTPANMRWKLVDRDTGAANAAIDWRFRVGDEIKIRLVNEMDSDHPMPHPFHVHGAGASWFSHATASRTEPDGRTRCSCGRARQSTSLDVTNPGQDGEPLLAEHHESGTMFGFGNEQREVP